MADDHDPIHLVEFEGVTGRRVALVAESVLGLVEQDDDCCQIVTDSDTYQVRASYDDARERIWPDRTPA